MLVGATSFNAGAFGSASGINVAGTQPLVLVHETDTDKDGFMGISASTMFLGTADAIPLRFSTSDTERVRIDASGNVGIGTTSPANKLDIVDSTAGFAARITNNNDGSQGLQVRTSDNDTGLYILDLQSSTSATGTNYSSQFVVEKAGHVGIGMTLSLIHI